MEKAVNQHKRMAMGEKVNPTAPKKKGEKGYACGGMVKQTKKKAK